MLTAASLTGALVGLAVLLIMVLLYQLWRSRFEKRYSRMHWLCGCRKAAVSE